MKKKFPDTQPLYMRALSWCWKRPPYVGYPLSVLALFLAILDLFYLLYWWGKNWGAEEY